MNNKQRMLDDKDLYKEKKYQNIILYCIIMANIENQQDNLRLEDFEGFFPTLLEYRLTLQDRGDDEFTIISKFKTSDSFNKSPLL